MTVIIIFSFVSILTFPLGSVMGQQPQEDSKYRMVNSNLRLFYWLYTKARDVITTPGPWSTFRPLSHGYSQQNLPH